jgi:ribosomal protein S18 acetylase RimI-like enzyme
MPFVTEQVLAEQVHVRPAQLHDVPAIAALLVEGFGHEYGGVLNCPAGQRMYERIYMMLPERLRGLIVAVDDQAVPIGIAGLRTHDTQPTHSHHTVQVMLQELGIARMLQFQLWVRLTAPPHYQAQRHEAYVHSMTVTARWRGRGIAAVLLERLHGMAADLGKTTVVLQVEEDNQAAHRLYTRYGYTVRQRRRGPLAWLPFGPVPYVLLEKHLGKG